MYIPMDEPLIGQRISIIIEKLLQMTATLPAAVFKRLQPLQTYFNITPKIGMDIFLNLYVVTLLLVCLARCHIVQSILIRKY